jgi:hypothetical protein
MINTLHVVFIGKASMKNYKYTTKDRAERVSKTLGCTGYHTHGTGDDKKYMPCKTHEIFKNKTDKKEVEVNELVDDTGAFVGSSIPILDPASSGIGTKTTDQIVQMARNPRDPLLRGWYGYYGESQIKEEDMEGAFGFDDTIFMDYDDTVKYYQKELGLDKESAIERTIQQGKKPNLHKRTPKKIKDKKNFIDRLILKEKGLDESEDIIEDIISSTKDGDREIKIKNDEINPLLLRNIRSLKKMAKQHGYTIKELIQILKNE